MSNEYRAKVFKSGNSVALRLPKALGLKDGDEMILREEQSEFMNLLPRKISSPARAVCEKILDPIFDRR